MTITDFEKLQAEMPTAELIEKARAWVEQLERLRIDIGIERQANDCRFILEELCRRLEKFEIEQSGRNARAERFED